MNKSALFVSFAVAAALSSCAAVQELWSPSDLLNSMRGGNVTNLALESSSTNLVNTIGLTVAFLTVTDAPPTYFSNWVVSNAGGNIYAITNVYDAVFGGQTIYKTTNAQNVTVYFGSTTNFRDCVTVAFAITNSTNISAVTNTNYSVINDSNFLITNVVQTTCVTNGTNALTNSVLLYGSMLAGSASLTNNTTNWFPVWRPVGLTGPSGVVKGTHTCLAFNNGLPCVAYMNGTGTVFVKIYSNGSWNDYGSPALSTGNTSNISFVIDNGVAYVAYCDYANSGKAIVKACSNGSGWADFGNPGFSMGNADSISLAAANGTPYVAYCDWGNGSNAAVMVCSNSTWTNYGSGTISDNAAFNTKLALNNGLPYIVYRNYTNYLNLMVCSNGTWTNYGNSGFAKGDDDAIGLAFDNNVPYVSFRNMLSGGRGSVCICSNGSAWQFYGSFNFTSDSTYYTSIAVNGGVPYVAFYDNGSSQYGMVMVCNDGANWTLFGGDYSTRVAQYNSLGIYNNILYVAYEDAFNGPAAVMHYK